MKARLNDVLYSFPIQLLVLHLKSNLILLAIWVILALFITGGVGNALGIKYLLLTPEYLGEINFISHFLVGLGFGAYLMSWNLTTYLLEAHRYPFLATLSRPFTKFCLNNVLLPLFFMAFYMGMMVYFQKYYEFWNIETVLTNAAGFASGTLMPILSSVMYFHFTNKDILTFLNIKDTKNEIKNEGIKTDKRLPSVDKLKLEALTCRVKTYLNESLRPRLVRSIDHYDAIMLYRVFKQNHLNALIIQLLSILLLIILGLTIERPHFMIPAGTSIFFLFSVLVAIVGAITYWFQEWRLLTIVLLIFGINFLTSRDILHHKNKGFGLNYDVPPASYAYDSLTRVCNMSQVKEDIQNTTEVLNNWKAKVTASGKKPKMVMVCVTGGGLRAALWAVHVMQQADIATHGALMQHTALISGSSGGVIGMAYLRELYLRQQNGQDVDIHDEIYREHITQDILNSLAFTIVSNDLFMPWVKFEVDGHTYRKDRGYVFEQQLNNITGNILDKRLMDYKEPEKEAIIPMLFITPSIINDGRKMVISPQGVSYMMVAPAGIKNPDALELDALDFRQLFAEQEADNLLFTSALRMNATYPYILPYVSLPSDPVIHVMDAGFRDNYGIMSATRFIHVFQDWIKENTSGVVLLQIRGRDKFEGAKKQSQGVIESILNPLGLAGQITDLQEYEHDSNLGFIFDLLGEDHFEIIRFTYQPSRLSEHASVTFHLTQREKMDILQAFDLERNQKSLRRLQSLLEVGNGKAEVRRQK